MSEPVKVALVDDQQLFRSGVATVIDAQPDMAVVGQAGDGAEALAMIEACAPDVVLMDLRMEPMDGVEATRRLFAPGRAAAGRRPPKVIVLTTFSLDERAALAIQCGASGFLLKDTTPEFLCEAIRTVHSGSAVIASEDLGALVSGALRSASPPPQFNELTAKEREVFLAAAEGLSNAEIGERLYMSESTVKTHVGSILRKLDLRDRVQLVVFAHRHNLGGEPGGE